MGSLNGTSKVNTQMDKQTDRRTDRRTFRLIESIGPEGRCFENLIEKKIIIFFVYSFKLLCTNSWSCSIILNRTRNLFPAPAPDCLCLAGLPSWSGTLFLNRTSENILPLCKVLFPGSLHPLMSHVTCHMLWVPC